MFLFPPEKSKMVSIFLKPLLCERKRNLEIKKRFERKKELCIMMKRLRIIKCVCIYLWKQYKVERFEVMMEEIDSWVVMLLIMS